MQYEKKISGSSAMAQMHQRNLNAIKTHLNKEMVNKMSVQHNNHRNPENAFYTHKEARGIKANEIEDTKWAQGAVPNGRELIMDNLTMENNCEPIMVQQSIQNDKAEAKSSRVTA